MVPVRVGKQRRGRKEREEKEEEREGRRGKQASQGGSGLSRRGHIVAWKSQVNKVSTCLLALVVNKWVRERPAIVSV
jgi:hypothetical protein